MQGGDGFAEDLCGEDAGVEDGTAVCGSVSAVDAASCEVDADVALFELRDPRSLGDAIPRNYTPWRRLRRAAEGVRFS